MKKPFFYASALFLSLFIGTDLFGQTKISPHVPATELQNEIAAQAEKGYYLVDFSGYFENGKEQFVTLWKKGVPRDLVVKTSMSHEEYMKAFDNLKKQGYRPDDIEVYRVKKDAKADEDDKINKVAAIFVKTDKEWDHYNGSVKEYTEAEAKAKKMAENGFNLVVYNSFTDYKRDRKYYYIVAEKNNIATQLESTMYFDKYHKNNNMPFRLNSENVIWQKGDGGYYSVKDVTEEQMRAEDMHAAANGYEGLAIFANESFGNIGYNAFYRAKTDGSLDKLIGDLISRSYSAYFNDRAQEMEQIKQEAGNVNKSNCCTELPAFQRMQWLVYSRLLQTKSLEDKYPEYGLLAWQARKDYIASKAKPALEKSDYANYAVYKNLMSLGGQHWSKDWEKSFEAFSFAADASDLLLTEGTYIKFKAFDTSAYRAAAIAATLSGNDNRKYNLKLMEMNVHNIPDDWIVYYGGILWYAGEQNEKMFRAYLNLAKEYFPAEAERWKELDEKLKK